MTPNTLHVYRKRHIFRGDDLIGKYDSATRTIRLDEDYAGISTEVRAHFIRALNIRAEVLVGADAVKATVPIIEFPEDALALMTPTQGDLTPAFVTWARQHLAPGDFNRHYHGRVDHLQPEEGTTGTADLQSASSSPSFLPWIINKRFLVAALDRETAIEEWDTTTTKFPVGLGSPGPKSSEEAFTIEEWTMERLLEPVPTEHRDTVVNQFKILTAPKFLGVISDEDDEDEQDEPEGGNQTTTDPVELNKLGLPLDAPDTYNDLKKYLQDRDVVIPRNINKDDLIALYKSQMTVWNGTPPPVNPAKL